MSEQRRSDDHLTGDERAQLDAFVHDTRAELAALLDGLTEEEARRRLVPSGTSLLSLLKHAAFVERVWFPVSLGGLSRAEVGVPDDAEESFRLGDEDSIASVVADHRAACAQSDEVAAAYGLDDLARHNRRGPLTLRWVCLHLVEELARHAGHGDILREQLLAARR